MGWVYLKCNKWIESLQQVNKSASLQAFVRAIEDELNDYYKLVAGLDEQVKLGNPQITLRSLVLWIGEPLKRLKWIYSIIHVHKEKNDASIFHTLDQFSKYGDPQISTLVNTILVKSAQPIIDMIMTWVFEGELKDNFDEFFISNDLEVTEYDLFWTSKYILRKDRFSIPPFIPENLASLILRVGKSINLLRKCKDTLTCNRVLELWQTDKLKLVNNNDVTYADILTQIIEPVAVVVDRQLLCLLLGKFKLLSHLRALNSYIFLSRSDFSNNLMDALWPELNKPMSGVYKHNLMRTLENVIHTSSAQSEPKEITNSLKISVQNQENTKNALGWNCFSLEYACNDPEVGIVLTNEVRSLYYKVFSLVWRIKRVSHNLKLVWELQNTYRKLHIIHECLPLLHRCHLLRNEMRNFIDILLDHFFNNVVHVNWKIFEKKERDIKNLDEFISAHADYLETVIHHLFLAKNEKQKLKDLVAIFDLIERFREEQDDLANDLFAFANHRKLQFEKNLENLTFSGNTLGDDDDEEEITEDTEDLRYNDRLTNIHIPKFTKCEKDFRILLGKLNVFQNNLDSEDSSFGELIATKLDFNSYYSKFTSKSKSQSK